MELICPDCRADLVIADAQTATCAGHNGRYQILFDRSLGQAQPGVGQALSLPEGEQPGQAESPSYTPPPRTLDIRCRQHPEVFAVARCRVCYSGVCETCDFLLPGNVHVCPSCLETEPSTEINPKRRNLAIGGIVVAVVSTLIYATIFTGAWARNFGTGEGAAMILGNLMLWPPILGLVLAASAFDRNLRNGPLIWIALVWNGIFTALTVLFMIIGLFSK